MCFSGVVPCRHLATDARWFEIAFRRFAVTPGSRSLGCAAATEQDYHAFRIGLGVPEGGRDYAFGDTFPHEALFDQLGGVDFEKGCFVGQEVVSRMEHRGTARKRIVPVESRMPLPAPGTNIEAGGMEIGTLGSVSGSSGLALVRLDRVEDALARGQGITADGKRIVDCFPTECSLFSRVSCPSGERSRR